MRRFVRLLVLVGLVVSSASLSPIALADPTDGSSASSGPSAGAGPTGNDGSVGAGSSPGADPASPSSDPSSDPTASPSDGPTVGSSEGPSEGASEGASGDPSASPSDPESGTASPKRLAAGTEITTEVTDGPEAPSLRHSATFRYTSNTPGVLFRCRLLGPGHTAKTMKPCDGSGSGSTTYENLVQSPKRYVFSVQAYVPDVATGSTATYGWRIYSTYRKDSYSPSGGARFNRPNSSYAARRTNLTHVIRTINSMPGYLQATKGAPCPTDRKLWPSTIRVSLYSMVDYKFSLAMRDANRRCASVQILMNNHLSAATDHSWKTLQDALGTSVTSKGRDRRSFARRCHFGCRGHGVLHTKMYLFDSQVPAPRQSKNKINDTTMVGSSNITSNATNVQYNDLFTVRSNAKVHDDFLAMFNRMKRGKKSSKLYTFNEGTYSSTFWPQGKSTDPYTTMFNQVHCSGANGGSGINGHTVLYINMHAWFGKRGLSLAKQVRHLYNSGCYVRVLYSFMSYGVFKILKKGTGARMSVRRTAFSHNGHTVYVYSHFKNIDISGHFGSDRSSWQARTGSNNFTDEGTHFDEVMFRINSRSAYNSYVRKFKDISAHKSSAIYANYSEPKGGGRAP